MNEHIGLPTSTSKRHSRAPSFSSSTSSRPPSQADVDMQDGTSPSTSTPTPTSPPPLQTPTQTSSPSPIQPTHNRHSSLEVPTINTHFSMPSPHHFPRPRSPSITPMPDNEVRAQASLSTQCAMSFAAVVQELAPIPCIGPLVGCLTLVFQAVEKTRVNK